MKLTKDMFNRFGDLRAAEQFDLRSGQMCVVPHKVTHNSGWYNAAGERLGWGDLSATDLLGIREALEPGQSFIITPEFAANSPDIKDKLAPGPSYVLGHMSYLITKDGLFAISDHRENAGSTVRDGVTIVILMRSEAIKKIQ